MSIITVPAVRRLTSVCLRVIGAGLLVAAMVAGADAWLRATHDGGRASFPSEPASVAKIVAPRAPAELPSDVARTPFVVYVVDTEDEAASTRDDLALEDEARPGASSSAALVLARSPPSPGTRRWCARTDSPSPPLS